MTLHIAYHYVCDYCGTEFGQQAFKPYNGEAIPRPAQPPLVITGMAPYHACEACAVEIGGAIARVSRELAERTPR